MKIIRCKNYEEMSREAAKIVEAVVALKNDAVLGFATGSTPEGLYANLAADCKAGKADFSKTITVNLDEYCGLAADHPQSYRYFMNDNLFNRVNIRKDHTFVPNGCAEDLKAEGEAYDAMIKELGGIDLQLLGIGLDGHIGFNEPDEFFTGPTHEVVLDESTIEANARFFEKKEDVPTTAITMGMMSIMQAKKVLLIANGAKKKEIVEKSFFGPITPAVPASILQLHPDLTVIYSEN